MEKTKENIFLSKTIGNADTGSRAKAESAHRRTERQVEEISEIPTNQNGKPLVRIQMAASELLPTGQYANVAIGPCQITAYIDPDRIINDESESGFFTEEERATMAAAANELAEIVERDVIGVQRALVLESLQRED